MTESRQRYGGGHRTSRRFMGASGMSLQTFTKKQIRYVVLFLYKADIFITEAETEVESEMLLFLELCKQFGCYKQLRDILNYEIKKAEEDDRLEIDCDPPEKLTKDTVFPVSHDRFKYYVDSNIAQIIPEELKKECNSSKIRLFVDIYRTIISATDEKEFQRIIYALFFGNGTVSDLKFVPPEKLPKKIRNLAYEYPMLEFLKTRVNLTTVEAAYLNMLFYIEQISLFRRFATDCDDLQSEIFQSFLDISAKEFNLLNRRSGHLRSSGFLMDDGYLDYDLKEAIVNQSMEYYFNDIIKPCSVEDSYEVTSFCVSKDKSDLMECFLKGSESCNLLLLGAPGAGKTAYAKALAKKSGLKIYVYINETEIQGARVIAKINAFLSMNQKDCVLIVDEADKILSTVDKMGIFGFSSPNSTKGLVNKMLEDSLSKAIWIVNYDDNIDESTKRRFTLSHYFDPMTENQLRSIASEKLEVLGMDEELHNRVLNLFGKYKLSGSSVDNVIKGLKSIGLENSERYAEMILKENSELQFGRQKMRSIVNNESYDLSIVNASTSADEIISMIENALKYAEKHPDKKAGIRMLFYGASGTGKTELVRKIAQKIGKSICLKRPSDILGKYVGESEKKIAMAFSECERTGSILLFDEADSFFADRNQADHNWERTTVNEFLTQMEEFSGILICTTNLRNIMDPAMQRRFHSLVEFKPLVKDGVKTLLGKYFPEMEFTDDQVESISRFDTATPGDFSSLEGRIRFMDEDKVNADFVVDELVKLQMEKNGGSGNCRCIGFSA